jgi:hypothetical protein
MVEYRYFDRNPGQFMTVLGRRTWNNACIFPASAVLRALVYPLQVPPTDDFTRRFGRHFELVMGI